VRIRRGPVTPESRRRHARGRRTDVESPNVSAPGVEATTGTYTVGELLPEATVETSTPLPPSERVQRPTVAATMKRIVEAIDALPNVDFGRSQRDAYEKTLDELGTIDADEGVRVVGD